MELIYAALLLHKAGKEINEGNVKRVLDAAGVGKDEGQVRALVSALKEMNIDEAIKQAAVVTAAPAASSASAEAKKEAPKDEGKSSEAAAAGLSSLFG